MNSDIVRPAPDLLNSLRHIVGAGVLPNRAQAIGQRLLQRLPAPVQVMLLGPREADKAALIEMLTSGPSAANPAMRDMVFSAPSSAAWNNAETKADIVVWLTDTFTDAELAWWNTAPDFLKDHSFLVAMHKANSDVSQARLAYLQTVADDHFCGLIRMTIPEDGRFDAAVPSPLQHELRTLVANGKQADRDNAAQFVAKHLSAVDAKKSATTVPTADEEAQVCAAPDGPDHRAPASLGIYEVACGYLRERAAELVKMPVSESAVDCEGVLTHCCETCDSIADMFAAETAQEPTFQLFREDILIAADKAVLMSLEGGVPPAIDAVTILLQLKRDLKMLKAS